MTYELNVAGLTRTLPICKVNDKLGIAAFILFSDVELTVRCAEALLAKCPDFDVIVTAESKGIPLAYEAARQCGKRYLVARKSIKLYMTEPVTVSVKSITTANVQKLSLSHEDAEFVRGKRVLLMDDVISTGESLYALEQLVHTAGGIIAGRAAVLAEGAAADRDDITFLETLPVFPLD